MSDWMEDVVSALSLITFVVAITGTLGLVSGPLSGV